MSPADASSGAALLDGRYRHYPSFDEKRSSSRQVVCMIPSMGEDGYVVPHMHVGQVTATVATVRRLLSQQFPQWAHLPLLAIPGGTDHAVFRLGEDLLVRMPLAESRGHAAKDARWLPVLADYLPLTVPTPVALGEPDGRYPWQWTVVPWIDGTTFDPSAADLCASAVAMAQFVRALHAAPTQGAPPMSPGQRGTPVHDLDLRVISLLTQLVTEVDVDAVSSAWNRIMTASAWAGDLVWLHTDLAPGNVIIRDGAPIGVIDFGLGLGDPAPDLLPAWLLFDGPSRELFLREVGYDSGTHLRALAWLLVPALGGLIYFRDSRPDFVARSRHHLNLAVAAAAMV